MALTKTLCPKSLLSIRAGCFALICRVDVTMYVTVSVLSLPHSAMVGLIGGTVL